ncbi:MAG: DUF1080 domain-containing protein [Ginsengibacter sp.]
MHKKTLFLLATILYVSCSFSQVNTMNTPDNTLSTKEKSSGWQLLFDGQSTNGWHSYGRPSATKAWNVKDGTLYLDAEAKKNPAPGEGGDLVTNEEYGNFDLKLDWKIGPKGNSGVIFYIQEDTVKYPDTYNTGMEMQVLDNGTPTRLGHTDGKLYSHRAGDLYDLLASKEAVNPQGEWNHVEIVSLNGKLDFYMNGEHSLSANLWDDHWKQMIAISKFKRMPGFGTFKKGKISLQDHGEDVWFKNIRIKRL